MEEQLGTITTDISLIRDYHRKLADRVKEGEKTLADLQPAISTQWKSLQVAHDRLAALEERLDDLEGRSRSCNVRVLGLPEGVEGAHPREYIESWIKSFTPPEERSAFFSIK